MLMLYLVLSLHLNNSLIKMYHNAKEPTYTKKNKNMDKKTVLGATGLHENLNGQHSPSRTEYG